MTGKPGERKRLRARLAELERQKKEAVARGQPTADIKLAIAQTQRALQRKPAGESEIPPDPGELGRAFQAAAKAMLEPAVYAEVLSAARQMVAGKTGG